MKTLISVTAKYCLIITIGNIRKYLDLYYYSRIVNITYPWSTCISDYFSSVFCRNVQSVFLTSFSSSVKLQNKLWQVVLHVSKVSSCPNGRFYAKVSSSALCVKLKNLCSFVNRFLFSTVILTLYHGWQWC